MRIQISTDPTANTTDLYSVYPTVGAYPSFTYVKGTRDYKEQNRNLSPANLRSAVAVSVQQGATVNAAAPSVWGSDTFLPLSHITTDAVTSSQATPLALVYQRNPPLADDMAVTLPNNPSHSFSDTDYISNTTD